MEGIDRALIEIIDRCLDKDPEERYQNVPQVLEALAVRERQSTRRPVVVLGLLGPLALLLGLAGVGLFARYQAVDRATSALTQQTLENALGYGELIAAVVDRNLSAVTRQVEREAEEPELRRLMALVAAGDARARASIQRRTDELYEAYRDRYLHNWVVADADAVALARTPFDDRVVGSRYAYREWFTGEEDVAPERAPADARPRTDSGVTLAFESTAAGNPLLVSVASPIWSEASQTGERRVLGVIAATVHLVTFNEWLSDAEGPRNETGCPDRFAVLLNRGQLVRHPCPSDEARRLPLARSVYTDTGAARALLESESGTLERYSDPLRKGGTYLAARVRFRDNGEWTAIVEHDRALAMSPITSLVGSFSTLGWLAAAFGLAIVIGLWALLYRVTREEPELAKRKDVIELDL